MDLLTAVAIVLARHNDATRLRLDCPRVGANGVETVRLTLGLPPDGSYATVREHVRAAIEHAEPPSSESAPIIVAALGEVNAGSESLLGEHLHQLRREHAQAELELVADPSAGALRCSFDVDLFDRASVQRLLEQIQHTFAQGTERPLIPIVDIDPLGAGERDELLALARASKPAEPACIHRLIEAHAATSPVSPAVTFAGAHLSYGELNVRANALAERLLEAGVQRGGRVGVRLERSAELIVALVGVLKAGAAYVPIEPHLPTTRQRQITSIAGVEVLICEADSPMLVGVRPVPLEGAKSISGGDLGSLPRATRAAITYPTDPADPAYVLFTSGTTGIPKGVAISHGQVTQLFHATEPLFEHRVDDVWISAHTFAFDASVWEIFGALIHGARVVIATREIARDPDALLSLIVSEGATMLTITPTAFEGLRDAALARRESLGTLRFVILCAEALSTAALAPWFARWGEVRPRLVNMYGITETTVHSSFHALDSSDVGEGRVRIGRALPDTSLYVLDERQRLVPFGVPGEIHVGGPRVAAGYLGAPEHEQRRFLADPFSSQDARLYRSGDRARWLSDGTLEYLGRRDTQVKIRGHRVELGEIEHALMRHPDLHAARACVLHRDGLAPVLAACFVSTSAAGPDRGQLRKLLAAHLPEYMLPSIFLRVEQLPLTENGKLDRVALVGMVADSVGAEPKPCSHDFSHTTELVRTVGAAMSRVLGLAQMHSDASFFELGGDSITAIRLVGRLRELGLDAELQHVYESRTPRALATGLAGRRSAIAQEIEPFALVHNGDELWIPAGAVDAYPVTRLQAGLLFQNALENSHYHDVLTYTLVEQIEETPLRQALSALVDAHPVLRTSFVVDGPSVPMQIVHEHADVACTFTELLSAERDVDALACWARDEKRSRFDWTIPGLLRVFVHRAAGAGSTLSLSVHHAILDGWSVASFVTELLLAYGEISAGRTPAISHDAQLLRRFVALEREAESDDTHAAFWHACLKGGEPAEIPSRDGPVDNRAIATPPGDSEHPAGGEVRLYVPKEIAGGVNELADELGLPLKTLYLAANVALVSYVCATPDVITGLVSNVRVEEPGGDEALGLFLNTLPIRLAPQELDWRALARAVFARELGAYRHRRYPFELIREHARVARLCPTAFNYTDFHVYDRFEKTGVALRGVRYFEKTDFQLLTTVAREPADGTRTVTLSYGADVEHEQAKLFGHLFLQLLRHAVHRAEEPVITALASWAEHSGLTYSVPALPRRDTRSPTSFLLERIQAQPTATALLHGSERQSFAELGVRITAIGAALQQAGVRRGERIACLLERGLDPLAALLGIWSLGASYVPIDPELPAARVRAMIELVGCRVALMSARVDPELAHFVPRRVLLDDTLPTAPGGSGSWSIGDPAAEAYVLFTSGSTGEPKAVGMPHRGIANLVSWQIRQPELTVPRHVSQFAPLSFDVSIQEMLAAACSGGTSCVISDAIRANPQALLQALAQQEVEVSFLPAVALGQLADYWRAFGRPALSLRYIVAAGEALVVTDAVRQMCADGATELINQYGPTETHVATCHRLGTDPDTWPQHPPIGWPLSNVQARVLDYAGRPIPPGTRGELYLGGECVADGYVTATGLHPLTAQRFVADTCETPAPGERSTYGTRAGVTGQAPLLYRTGDIVGGSPNGLVFHGRNDDQVKIRGHRVEPREVAAVMIRHPDVNDCAVRAWRSAGDTLELVAYVVLGERAATVEALLAHARAELPSYAVPAQVEVMHQLPTTRNGKLDVRSLPKPLRARPSAETAHLTATERVILDVWRRLLGHPVESPTLSFFDAGGNSLMVLQLYGLVQRELGCELQMHDLFRFPSARELAGYIDRVAAMGPGGVRRHSVTSAQIQAAATRNRASRRSQGDHR